MEKRLCYNMKPLRWKSDKRKGEKERKIGKEGVDKK